MGKLVSLEAALGASARSVTRLDPELTARLQAIAQLLLPEVDSIARVVNQRAVAAEPNLVEPDDGPSLDAVLQSTRANVGAILSMLAYGVPGAAGVPAAGALMLFERLAERDDGLAIILRGYRLGIMELWQIWARHLAGQVEDAGDLHRMLAASTSVMLTYIDRVSSELHEQWTATRRRHRQGLNAVPEELIDAALSGPLERADLSGLGYDLARPHLAIALDPALEDERIGQLASRLALEANGQHLEFRAERAWIIWLALEDEPTTAGLGRVHERLGELSGTTGIGDLARGTSGFRSSHREALDARRVGLLRQAEGPTVHHDVALLAVLCADTERARALAAGELGPLAASDDGAARLRDTLRAYLANGESQVAAAHTLGVHHKTVAYRLRRAEQLLGRRVDERRAELEAALLLHDLL